MPGMVTKRYNPVIVALAFGRAPEAIVHAGMRKVVHLIYAVIELDHPCTVYIPRASKGVPDPVCFAA